MTKTFYGWWITAAVFCTFGIAVGILMAAYPNDAAALETALHDLPTARRLGLDQAKTVRVMEESAAEISALSDALG